MVPRESLAFKSSFQEFSIPVSAYGSVSVAFAFLRFRTASVHPRNFTKTGSRDMECALAFRYTPGKTSDTVTWVANWETAVQATKKINIEEERKESKEAKE